MKKEIRLRPDAVFMGIAIFLLQMDITILQIHVIPGRLAFWKNLDFLSVVF